MYRSVKEGHGTQIPFIVRCFLHPIKPTYTTCKKKVKWGFSNFASILVLWKLKNRINQGQNLAWVLMKTGSALFLVRQFIHNPWGGPVDPKPTDGYPCKTERAHHYFHISMYRTFHCKIEGATVCKEVKPIISEIDHA